MTFRTNLPRRYVHKYAARKTELDGRSFGSKLEASVYLVLKAQAQHGMITLLGCQDHVTLIPGKRSERIGCIPDFKVQNCATSEVYWVEAKGFPTQRWQIIRKLWRVHGPGRMVIYGGDWRRPIIIEQIEPVKHQEGNAS